jgi:tripartite-type tricarboxylate transporter receptor subunit TctC
MQQLDYNPVTQLSPIGIFGFNGFVLGVTPSFPPNNFGELLAYVRNHPGEVNYGIAQVGTVSQLLPALIGAQQKLNLVGVPFNSGPATLTGVMQGTVQMVFGNPSDLLPPAADHRVKLLAVSSEKRLPQLPDVPAVSETIPGFSFTAWNGYFAPAGTPKTIIDRISAELIKIGKSPEVVEKFDRLALTPAATTPEEMSAIIQREIPMYEAAVKAAGLMKKDN